MKLQDPLKQYPPFDVAAGQAQMFLAQGYTEIKPFVPVKPKQPMVWFVREGAHVGDYQCSPVLWHSCPECGTKGTTDSPNGTAHKTTKVYHCGQKGIMCPPDVAAQYEKAYAAWKSRSRKPPVEKISPVSPAHHVRAFGLKSRQQLILEATTAVRSSNGK